MNHSLVNEDGCINFQFVTTDHQLWLLKEPASSPPFKHIHQPNLQMYEIRSYSYIQADLNCEYNFNLNHYIYAIKYLNETSQKGSPCIFLNVHPQDYNENCKIDVQGHHFCYLVCDAMNFEKIRPYPKLPHNQLSCVIHPDKSSFGRIITWDLKSLNLGLA